MMATGDSLVKAELGHAMSRIAKLERDLVSRNSLLDKYNDDNEKLNRDLAEARKWTPITSKNLPKKGDVFFMRLQENGFVGAGVATVDWQLSTISGDCEQWSIAPPAPEVKP
jgi:hypothetical protein